MAITSTSGIDASTQSANVSIQDFLKILTAQLNNQDPLKPLDNEDFVAQIAQFASLEQSRQLNAKIDNLVSLQSTLQTVGMLGRTVDVSVNGNTVSGKVSALDLGSGTPLLTLTMSNGTFLNQISLSQVLNIR